MHTVVGSWNLLARIRRDQFKSYFATKYCDFNKKIRPNHIFCLQRPYKYIFYRYFIDIRPIKAKLCDL